ncbi:carboxylesterase/lipase family protein [Bradyrhizobium sp. LHD-71]|uniref:carboxylesterase/lipase family protein n=1 Tax=Bradyrhizobium sp. LHD-71 TaxID=3072141 RepID=UPI00280FE44A|nr:carboxylesterase/lipase family protein [Bradyrhizobium sp. LHD-71]MDQ8727110.1 carboxylesterase/lipase family protein [Bradyrhizobium sp. LHD-71]
MSSATAHSEIAEGAIVETTAGRLRGIVSNGVHQFKGVRYGEATEGLLRFMPPQPVSAWTGIQDATSYGPSAPQFHNQMPGNFPAGPPPIHDVYKWYWAADLPVSEDCLSLNVFTSSVNDNTKRPVMIWLHGGAFANGSGTAPGFDGTSLARDGDVVVVTVNHRLNIFGHLFLGAFNDERFADAGNCGMLDLVAALEWVSDNIEGFGGDPDNVTIFGESGGGAKVAYLMAMPAARGLFHKAIIQSAGFRAIDPNGAARAADKVLEQLGINKSSLGELAYVPRDRLLEGMSAVTRSENGNDYFRPVTDGRTLFERPFHDAAPTVSADIPLLMGTCEAEATFSMTTDMRLFSLSRDELVAEAGRFAGVGAQEAEQLFAAYARANPTAQPVEVYCHIRSDLHFRMGTIHAAELKVKQNAAPLYKYLFTWKSPALNGMLGATHTLEIPFVFGTVDLTPEIVCDAPDRHEVSRQAMAYWVNFARQGNPNGNGLPHWPAYSLAQRETMLIDRVCRTVSDPHRVGRELSAKFYR